MVVGAGQRSAEVQRRRSQSVALLYSSDGHQVARCALRVLTPIPKKTC